MASISTAPVSSAVPDVRPTKPSPFPARTSATDGFPLVDGVYWFRPARFVLGSVANWLSVSGELSVAVFGAECSKAGLSCEND